MISVGNTAPSNEQVRQTLRNQTVLQKEYLRRMLSKDLGVGQFSVG
jgi:hypothetical protein